MRPSLTPFERSRRDQIDTLNSIRATVFDTDLSPLQVVARIQGYFRVLDAGEPIR